MKDFNENPNSGIALYMKHPRSKKVVILHKKFQKEIREKGSKWFTLLKIKINKNKGILWNLQSKQHECKIMKNSIFF